MADYVEAINLTGIPVDTIPYVLRFDAALQERIRKGVEKDDRIHPDRKIEAIQRRTRRSRRSMMDAIRASTQPWDSE